MNKPLCYMENSESKEPQYYKSNSDNKKHVINLVSKIY